MPAGRALSGFTLIVFALSGLAGATSLGALTAAPLQVTVSSEVIGFCESPVWNQVTLHANVTGGVPPYAYGWDWGDGSPISTDTVPTHHYDRGGKYTANVTVTDSVSTSASGSATFFVVPPPCAPRSNSLFQLPPSAGLALVLAGSLIAVVIVALGTRRRKARP
jgi:hypothetical protein